MTKARKTSPESISSFPFASHGTKRKRNVQVRHPSTLTETPVATAQPEQNGARFEVRRAGELVPWPDLNPRRHFDNGRIAELIESIRTRGIHVPLLVHDDGGAAYQIVAGERRWRAAMELGPDTEVPCLVRTYTLDEALEIALIENLDRADLTAIEEARGFKRLLELDGMTQAKLAEKIGRSQPYIANRIRLLELPDEALGLVEEGLIDPTAARDLLLPFAKIPPAKREKMYAGVATRIRSDTIGLTTDRIRRMIGEIASSISHSLTKNEYDKGAPVFNVALHEKCTCNGPEYEYSWRKERRCFDGKWWGEQQQKAKTAAGERKKATIEKALEKAEQVNGKPVLTEKTFHAKYKHGDYAILAEGRRVQVRGHNLLDPSLLPAESLILVDDDGEKWLACVDARAIKKAKAAAEAEEEALLKVRQDERVAREKAQVAKLSIEPWMLRLFLSEDVPVPQAEDVAVEHGISFDDDGAAKLSDAEVGLIFRVMALRSRDNAGTKYYYKDPIEQEVRTELEKKYAPLVEALLPPRERRPRMTADMSDELDAHMELLERFTEQLEEEGAVSDIVDEMRSAIRDFQQFIDAHPGTSMDLTDDDRRIVQRARTVLADAEKDLEEDDAGDDRPDPESLGFETGDFGDYKCVECGCTDSHSCEGGCSWLVKDANRRVGVCSSCAKTVPIANRMLNDSFEVPA